MAFRENSFSETIGIGVSKILILTFQILVRDVFSHQMKPIMSILYIFTEQGFNQIPSEVLSKPKRP